MTAPLDIPRDAQQEVVVPMEALREPMVNDWLKE